MFAPAPCLAAALTVAIVVLPVLLLAVRWYADNGGRIPIPMPSQRQRWRGSDAGARRGRCAYYYYYVRRYRSPSGARAAMLRRQMAHVCEAAGLIEDCGGGGASRRDGDGAGRIPSLPHRFLHDGDDAAMRDKFVLVCYARRVGSDGGESPGDEPVMFHVMFRSRFASALVLHLGLVVVHPSHRRRGLQGLSRLNALLTSLSLLTWQFVMTDIGASPSGSRQIAETTSSCVPNYRHSDCVRRVRGGASLGPGAAAYRYRGARARWQARHAVQSGPPAAREGGLAAVMPFAGPYPPSATRPAASKAAS